MPVRHFLKRSLFTLFSCSVIFWLCGIDREALNLGLHQLYHQLFMLHVCLIKCKLNCDLLKEAELRTIRGGLTRFVLVKFEATSGGVVIVTKVQSAFQTVLRDQNLESNISIKYSRTSAIADLTDLDGVLSYEKYVSCLVLPLSPKEDVRVEVYGGPARVLRHAMTIVDIVGDVLSHLLVQQVRVSGVCAYRHGQQSVYDYVGVPDIIFE